MNSTTEDKLEPDQIKRNLTRAGLLLVAYELLKFDIVYRVRADFKQTGRDYRAEVLNLAEKRFEASCRWLAANGAFSEASVMRILEIEKHRHEVAHELPRFLLDPDSEINTGLLRDAFPYLTSLSQFWQAREIDASKPPHEVFENIAHMPSTSAFLMRYILQVSNAGTSDDDAAT